MGLKNAEMLYLGWDRRKSKMRRLKGFIRTSGQTELMNQKSETIAIYRQDNLTTHITPQIPAEYLNALHKYITEK
jgi:hypothetical protein